MRKKNLLALIGGIVLSVAIGASLAGCGKEEAITKSDLPTEAAVLPESGYTSTAAVHDPSVFYDENSETYYVFGSHFASASSTDLVNWKQKSEDTAGVSNLFGVSKNKLMSDVLKETYSLTGGDQNIWAPDVIYLNDKYYMYYCVTSAFGSNKSVIGRVEADDPLGPYENETIVLESVTTTESSHPNCIDPELFYDKDGGLWMVYGSFFSGIYVKELDSNGLPVSDGWGKCIWAKGYSAGVEGPFIFYNEYTGYYYLMVSEGDLSTVYNMRVARSTSPDGPYVDITGADVATSSGKGNKIAGNYQFDGDIVRYALGHNSVTEKDGTFYVICHVRSNGGHHLEAHQLYFNEDGWPVMNPNRYTGEVRGLVTMEQAAGTYDVVVHSIETVQTTVPSEKYTFAADGSITDASGAQAGTWSVTSDYYVTITLNNIEYKGVLAAGWRDYGEKQGIYCMTATSSTGNPIWANAAE